jgi:site-specific recombinase XerD
VGLRTIKYLSPDETKRFFAKIVSTRDKALFFVMYTYGLRCLEASLLDLANLRLKDGRLYITAAKHGISGEVVLTREARRVLDAYLKERNKRPAHTTALFVSRKSRMTNGRLSTTHIYRLFQQYARQAKLPLDKQHPHVLRHSIAVHMADGGVPQEHVKEHLRHRKISSTDEYYEITNKKRHEFQARALASEFVVKI